MILNEIKFNMTERESLLSEFATKSCDAIKIKNDNDDIRPAFFRDVDKIIHSLSYTRYIDKTQVFSFETNDNISKRIVHVQLVSKIARTIGRALKLNEDLIEAISLGHDIGHTPLGHPGEAILNEISLRETGKMFNHNIQSVREYLVLENNGKGINLSIQVLDGIMCHNGEMVSNIYEPIPKTKDSFLEEYQLCYTDNNVLKKIRPMTLEGCVVRISDIIGYIGRDIEDAINVGLIKRNEIPDSIKNVLGITNSEIVNTIILDIVNESYGKPYIKMSDAVFNAVFELKKFNYKYIYERANSKEKLDFYREKIDELYKKYLSDIRIGNVESDIFLVFLNNMCDEYINKTSDERKVLDYIAGMTDDYLTKMIEKNN